MFSWKKQNPPSQQRQQRQAHQGTSDYSDLIAQGMRLANEDINDDDMGDINDEDLGDIDLDDPELLAELQGLTGEAPAPKPKPAAAPSRPIAKAPVPVQTTKPVAAAPPPPKPAPVAKAPPTKVSSPAQLPNKPSPSTTPAVPPSLTGLGFDLDGVMDDNDDEEVELTEDDWKDPHLLAQLQLLGGHTEHHDKEPQKTTETPAKTVSSPKAEAPIFKPLTQTTPIPSESGPLSPPSPHSLKEQRRISTSSSMIAIPPKDQAFGDEDIDGDSFMAEQQQEDIRDVDESSAPSPVKAKPQKRAEEIPKKNDKNLLELLKTRDLQYKKAAIEAKKAGNMPLAAERAKVFKGLQPWIRLVEAGGFLDLELYPIPDEPPALATIVKNDVGVGGATPASPSIQSNDTEAKTPVHPVMAPTPDTTTQDSIAEASAEDMRSGSNLRGAPGRGFEIKQLAADDDFQIVSNSSDDTYDMLQSQLESQINMCKTAYKYYYYQSGDLQTAVKFRSLEKTFIADLESLQSHRSHGKKAPAFHFQDVRFELEVGYYQEIGLNDLSLNIVRAWDLSHKDVQPSDIEAYVLWDLGWPTENMAGAGSGKGSTPTAKRSSKPEFNFTKTLGIQRGMAFQRFAEKKKITFEVWHYRGFLWKGYFIGRAQLPLAALLNHSEIHQIIPLMDASNRRSTGAKIEVQIRLQQPLLRRLGFPTPALTAPGSRPAGGVSKARTPAGRATKAATAPASPAARTPNSPASARSTVPVSKPAPPKQAATSTGTPTTTASPARDNRPAPVAPKASVPAPKPPVAAPAAKAPVPTSAIAGDPEESESEKALSELNNVDLLVSNMVLESEIQQAKQMIHDARAVGNSEAAEEYQDRLTQLEIKMKLLVIRVQTGQLTMDAYCQSVNERIAKDRALAIEFKRIGMIAEAKKALARSKIMAQEMKEVEEAMAAQGE
ncbi:Coiled-coil and C2 domain-containing protein 1B [Mortierella sp. AD010]|nr:Coiled-coil and C2 domain-containing protein 1B [Mortierella sp. AD010]